MASEAKPGVLTAPHTPEGPRQDQSSRQRLAWRVLLAIGTGTALSLMGDTALYAVLPAHTDAAGITLLSVGVLLSANRWVRLPLNGLAGVAYDRWPRRWLFILALFVGAASTAVYALTRGFWPLLAGRLLWGLAWSGIWVGGNTIILDVTTPADRGRWTGLYQLSFYLGSTLGFPAGGFLTDWLGYHPALLVAAAVTTLGAVFTLLTLPETRGWHQARYRSMAGEDPEPAAMAGSRATAQGRPVERQPHNGREATGGRQARRRLAPATLLYTGNRFVVAGIITATLSLLVQQHWSNVSFGGDGPIGVASITGVLLGLNTLISMFAAPLAGHWSDRSSNRWRVVARGLLPGVLGLALLAAGQPALILLAVPLTALTSGSNQSLATALLGDVTLGERRGRALGWMHTFGDLGSAIAPPLAYAVLPWIGLPGIYLASAALLLVMFIWAWRLAREAPDR